MFWLVTGRSLLNRSTRCCANDLCLRNSVIQEASFGQQYSLYRSTCVIGRGGTAPQSSPPHPPSPPHPSHTSPASSTPPAKRHPSLWWAMCASKSQTYPSIRGRTIFRAKDRLALTKSIIDTFFDMGVLQARGVVDAVCALHDANRGEAITTEVIIYIHSMGPPKRRYPYIRWYAYIRRPKSLGATEGLHS